MTGVLVRETLRFIHQRERFIAALVRPLVWLLIFAVGFRSALGVSIIPPYETYIPYEVYILPGLIGMVQLFNGMQNNIISQYFLNSSTFFPSTVFFQIFDVSE